MARRIGVALTFVLPGCDGEDVRFALVVGIALTVFVGVPVARMVRDWLARRAPDEADIERIMAAFESVYPDYGMTRIGDRTVRVVRGEASVEVDLRMVIEAASHGIDSISAGELAMDAVRDAIGATLTEGDRRKATEAFLAAARSRPQLDAEAVGDDVVVDVAESTVAVPSLALATALWGVAAEERVPVALEVFDQLFALGHAPEISARFLTPTLAARVPDGVVTYEVPGLSYPVVYLHRTQRNEVFVERAWAAERGLDETEIHELALDGLGGLLPMREDIRGLVVIHDVDGEAAANLLVIPRRLRGDDEIAAFAPAQDTLLLWEADDWEAALEARERAAELERGEAPLTGPIAISTEGFDPVEWTELDGSSVEV